MQNNTLPKSAAFVRLPTILKILPISPSTWWAGVKSGHFPKGVRLGRRITARRVEDICKLITSNKEGGSDGTGN